MSFDGSDGDEGGDLSEAAVEPQIASGEMMIVGTSVTAFDVGDIVRAPRLLTEGTDEREDTLRLSEFTELGWRASLVDFNAAKVRQRKDVWIVEQPLRDPASRWFGYSRYGDQAESSARQCKQEWDSADCQVFLAESGNRIEGSSMLLYSLDKARKCDMLEAVGLLSGKCTEAQAEWARRQAAAKYKTNQQQTSMDDDSDGTGDARGDNVAPCSQ